MWETPVAIVVPHTVFVIISDQSTTWYNFLSTKIQYIDKILYDEFVQELFSMCMFICMCMCVCVCVYVYLHVYVYVCVYVYLHVYVCLCVCVYVCVWIENISE